MDWKQEVLKRLDTLAEKLGTTATYLWMVLVRQAVSDGIVSILWAVVTLILAIVGYRVTMRGYKSAKDSQWDDFPIVFASGIFILVLGVVCTVLNTAEAIQHLYNPGYYALHEVLQTLGK